MLLTCLVFSILKFLMTERKRATQVRETASSKRVSYPDLCVGAERYRQDMTRFPILSSEQTLTAVFAFQSGSSVDRLRSHTLFAPHLQAEEKRYYQDDNSLQWHLEREENSLEKSLEFSLERKRASCHSHPDVTC